MSHSGQLKKRKTGILLFLLPVITVALLFSTSASLPDENDSLLIGVKIYQYKKDFSVLFNELKGLGINTVFAGLELAVAPDFINTARRHGIKTFMIVPVFCSIDKPVDIELSAVTAKGEKASSEWVHFFCPSNEDFRKQKIQYIKGLIRTYNPDGISIDFIRYFVYWEKVYPGMTPDPLNNTCFCRRCIQKMRDQLGFRFPGKLDTVEKKAKWILENHKGKWVDWKKKTISSMLAEISEAAREEKPQILLNAHIVPWRKNDFNLAISVVAAQDIAAFSLYVDYLSPMCYAHMVKRDSRWIHSVVNDFDGQINQKIIPSIQVKESYLKEKLTGRIFRESLTASLKKPSGGVIFWNWAQLETDSEKKEIIKKIIKGIP